ncbi:hypothetical protein DM860_003495 [Cuscuta australis]|uniref:Uncharacterized protein n=1 Tax=Cuscuta australis TaxID=267555 RepID=A0A328DH24_9ASTE|nr:hypothetical protein DM860_003495 [Cuscuta australis]
MQNQSLQPAAPLRIVTYPEITWSFYGLANSHILETRDYIVGYRKLWQKAPSRLGQTSKFMDRIPME